VGGKISCDIFFGYFLTFFYKSISIDSCHQK
jgi:hypothetical protein